MEQIDNEDKKVIKYFKDNSEQLIKELREFLSELKPLEYVSIKKPYMAESSGQLTLKIPIAIVSKSQLGPETEFKFIVNPNEKTFNNLLTKKPKLIIILDCKSEDKNE